MVMLKFCPPGNKRFCRHEDYLRVNAWTFPSRDAYDKLSIFYVRTGFKLIILDEADNMTSAAQFALRRGSKFIFFLSEQTHPYESVPPVIENYTANTRFCLICNYVNKIIPALQSRCTRFRFSPLGSHHIRPRLKEIATAEGWVCH
jgi:replication factor C subunit 3/5